MMMMTVTRGTGDYTIQNTFMCQMIAGLFGGHLGKQSHAAANYTSHCLFYLRSPVISCFVLRLIINCFIQHIVFFLTAVGILVAGVGTGAPNVNFRKISVRKTI